jgi:hypothetical protein
MTPEEAQLTGTANQMIENNLSSVKIIHNTKGTNWEIKVKHEDPYKAALVAGDIDKGLSEKYGIK